MQIKEIVLFSELKLSILKLRKSLEGIACYHAETIATDAESFHKMALNEGDYPWIESTLRYGAGNLAARLPGLFKNVVMSPTTIQFMTSIREGLGKDFILSTLTERYLLIFAENEWLRLRGITTESTSTGNLQTQLEKCIESMSRLIRNSKARPRGISPI